jgi:mono/diheme cytochrome c family protein
MLLWVFWSGIALSAQGAVDVPPSSGADLLRAKCLACHEADVIRQQRLTRAGWQRELDKMIRWGAAVKTDEERNRLLEYLTIGGQQRSDEPSLDAAGERGANVFKGRCLVCHEADVVEQQRLGRAAWTREVDKMIRWGATVGETDKDSLVVYLASRFGPR